MWQALQDYLHQNPLIAWSIPVYAVLIGLEVFLSQYQGLKFYSLRDALMNLWLNIANTLIGLSVKVLVLGLLFFGYQHALFSLSHSPLYWGLLALLLDACFYFEHRAEHNVRVLWAVHVTHHSSTEFNLSTGFRSSVFRPFVSCWFFLPLAFMGFHPLDILLVDAVCQIYGIVVHTRYIQRMPAWFETLFVSPSHHRVHHARNIPYLDKNMGMVLIVWDKLFGTFQAEMPHEVPEYGITKAPTHPHHPIRIITHEWEAIRHDLRQEKITWSQRLSYLIMPPGWRHDGKGETTKQLQKKV
jgi:sterol desaturase/sphingolipid hydroxylase (fatty acid hydroxylase superfamily)